MSYERIIPDVPRKDIRLINLLKHVDMEAVIMQWEAFEEIISRQKGRGN